MATLKAGTFLKGLISLFLGLSVFVARTKGTDITCASQGRAYDIVLNYGQNVASLEAGAHVSKGPTNPNEMLRTDWTEYDASSGFTYVIIDGVIEVEFRIAFLLNTIQFLLWDGDNRYYRYKVDVSQDGVNWSTVCDKSTSGQYQSWQYIEFDELSIAYVRIIGTYNSVGLNLDIVKFMAYNDFMVSQCQYV